MKLFCLMLSVALLAAPVFAREDPPPQDPNAAPGDQGQAGTEAAPQQSPDPLTPDPSQPPAPAPAAPAMPAPIALGDFAIKLATSLGLPPPATGYTPESAAWSLSLKGVKVRPDLSSPLTEADAVTVLNGLGYKVRTTTPSRVVTADKVELLLSTFIPPGKS